MTTALTSALRSRRTPPVAWTAAGLVLVGIAYVAPLVAVAVLLLVFGALFVARRTGDAVTVLGAVVLLAFAIPSPYVFTPLGGSASPAALVALFAFWCWCMGRIVPSLRLATGRQPIRPVMWCFAATNVASVAVAFARVLPESEAKAPYRALVATAAALGLALLAADGIPNRARLEQLLRWITWGAAFAGFVALLQFFSITNLAQTLKPPGLGTVNDVVFIQTRNGLNRAAGIAAHPIELAVLLTAALPLALFFALRDQREGRFNVVVRWLPFALVVAAIPTTLSRTAVIGLVVFALWMLPVWSWKRRMIAVGATFGIIALVDLVNAKVLDTIVGLFTNASQDVSITTRQSDYANGFRIIGQSPLFGRGFKTFLPTDNFFIDNEYLIHTIETGILGLLALVALFLVAVGTAEGARRHAPDADTRDLARALGAAVLVIGVTFATFDALSFPLVTTLTFLLIGCSGALWRLVRNPAPAST
ncbi:MAG: O-antigen ligase family protein [Acidimicrobiia bacterium]